VIDVICLMGRVVVGSQSFLKNMGIGWLDSLVICGLGFNYTEPKLLVELDCTVVIDLDVPIPTEKLVLVSCSG